MFPSLISSSSSAAKFTDYHEGAFRGGIRIGGSLPRHACPALPRTNSPHRYSDFMPTTLLLPLKSLDWVESFESSKKAIKLEATNVLFHTQTRSRREIHSSKPRRSVALFRDGYESVRGPASLHHADAAEMEQFVVRVG